MFQEYRSGVNFTWTSQNYDVLQVKVNAEEPAEHQETDVDAREEPGNTNSVEKETNVNCHEYINFVKDV